MAIITIPKKVKGQYKRGQMVRVTDWTHEYLRALKQRSRRPMSEVLEMILRQVDAAIEAPLPQKSRGRFVREARP